MKTAEGGRVMSWRRGGAHDGPTSAMNSPRSLLHHVAFVCGLALLVPLAAMALEAVFQGWSPKNLREEVRPVFSSDEKGSLVITHDLLR